ncbi:hypothetical protein [Halorussus halobius]|uniref:hypothetical protein n=1 Tax=Halorussus halobius TaxID=1710537 RepID=UPI001091B734|nr:hypothetical protein [Halorussus halobius]
MSAFRVVLLALLVAGTVAVVAPTAATAADAAEATGDATLDATAAQNETENASTLGGDISSFMQSNAAEVDGAVRTGMWAAAYDATDNRTVRTQLVERRTGDLRAELADLRERKQELADAREAGEVSDAAYRARVGGIVGRIHALESALDETETRARQVNASVEDLDELRSQTDELAGPEIASVARNLSGVGAGERGPPTGVGNGTGPDDGNRTGVGAANGNGNANGDQNGTRAGTDVGNGNGVGEGSPDGTSADASSDGEGSSGANASTGGSGERAGTDGTRGGGDRGNGSDGNPGRGPDDRPPGSDDGAGDGPASEIDARTADRGP